MALLYKQTNYELNNAAFGKVKYWCHLESLLYLMFNVLDSFDLKYPVMNLCLEENNKF